MDYKIKMFICTEEIKIPQPIFRIYILIGIHSFFFLKFGAEAIRQYADYEIFISIIKAA